MQPIEALLLINSLILIVFTIAQMILIFCNFHPTVQSKKHISYSVYEMYAILRGLQTVFLFKEKPILFLNANRVRPTVPICLSADRPSKKWWEKRRRRDLAQSSDMCSNQLNIQSWKFIHGNVNIVWRRTVAPGGHKDVESYAKSLCV